MAASLLTAMCRLRIMCAPHCSLLGSRSIRTRPPVYPGDQAELESDGEPEDDVERDINRRQKAILLKRMKREMEPPEPAERRLTWNAIQQIRYLRQEFPEEWPLSRLAAGFNVSSDAIKKVLKSRFIPSDARRTKQDAAAFRVLGQSSPGSTNGQLQIGASPKAAAQPFLPLQGDKRQLAISQSNQLLPPPKASDSSQLVLRTASLTKSHDRPQVPQGSLQGVSPAVSSQDLTTSIQEEPDQTMNRDEGRHDEKWDGEVLSDTELEELANIGVPNNMKVVQQGREFYDSDGIFLYRI
ncbi:neugrin isoform X2 [Hyla sarda]|uniref:neugrin isoform X2 n=1 Tax=Hyla sarda TaxID=327740 RepID=UPI0024C310F4|nr:neugrin isoform X2 [Hyla sarda]